MRLFVTRNFAGHAVAICVAALLLLGTVRHLQAQFGGKRVMIGPAAVAAPAGAVPAKGDKKAKEADEAAK